MTSDLHDLTDRELYRMSLDIAEVLVARAKCRLADCGSDGYFDYSTGNAEDGREPYDWCPACGRQQTAPTYSVKV